MKVDPRQFGLSSRSEARLVQLVESAAKVAVDPFVGLPSRVARSVLGLFDLVILTAPPRPGLEIRLSQRISETGNLVIVGSEQERFDPVKLVVPELETLGGPESQLWIGGYPRDANKPSGELPLIVSFYTVGTAYEEEALHLIQSLQTLRLEHRVEPLKPKGNWEANCAMKPGFVRDMFRSSGRPILWVDADAVIRRAPDLLSNAAFDFAIHKIDRWEFASGTSYFNQTEFGALLLDRWVANCERHPEQWDQIMLDLAWESTMDEVPLHTRWLPPTYTKIFDRGLVNAAESEVVIEHFQASRRFKEDVSVETSSSRASAPSHWVPEAWRAARSASRARKDRPFKLPG